MNLQKDHKEFEIILEAYQSRGYSKGARSILFATAASERASHNECKENTKINEEI